MKPQHFISLIINPTNTKFKIDYRHHFLCTFTLLFGFLLFCFSFGHSINTCSSSNNCQNCLKTFGCGWCDSVCLEGDEVGIWKGIFLEKIRLEYEWFCLKCKIFSHFKRGPFWNTTLCAIWLFGSPTKDCVVASQKRIHILPWNKFIDCNDFC
jgi:hypothetical protein